MASTSSEQETPEERFTRLLRVYGASLQRLTVSYEGNPNDREDLFQEICLAIWKALKGFRDECSERTFLFRIGHNRGLTHRWRRKPTHTDMDAAASVPDPGEPPDEAVQRTQRHHGLMSAVRQLPEPQHQIVVLSLEGLSHREIAEIIGITENNVGVRLTRARQTLRTLLDTQEGKQP